MTLITGNTYPVKDAIKALAPGKVRWGAEARGWLVPDEVADKARELVADKARELVASAGTPKRGPRRGRCTECGAWGDHGEECRECCEGYFV